MSETIQSKNDNKPPMEIAGEEEEDFNHTPMKKATGLDLDLEDDQNITAEVMSKDTDKTEK